MTAVAAVVSDAELVEQAQGGNTGAFTQLFDRHVGRVTAVCRQRLRCASDVDDAVQESFARALDKLGDLREASQFGAWVRSIAVRACTDHHRTARRTVVLADGIDLTDAAPQPDELVESAERSAMLRASLAELGPRDAQALWLRHVAEAPVAAVAMELGMTEGSTRVMLTRARHRLRAVSSGLGAVIPLSWRQWFRDHLAVPGPALDAMAVAAAVAIVTGSIAGGPSHPAEASPPPPVPADAPVIEKAPRKAPAREAGAAPARVERRDAPAAADSSRAAASRRGSDDPAPPTSVTDAVKVRDEYPSEGEAEELADVQLYGDGEQGNVKLYADDLGVAGPVVEDAARDGSSTLLP